MYLSFLTDEAIDDFAAALKLGAELGLNHAEIRLVDGVNVLDLNDEQIKRAKQLLDDHGLTVSAVATPFFKCPLPGQEPKERGPLHGARILSYADHVALLSRGVEITQAFGTKYLRIFSFWGDEGADFWPALDEAIEATLAATAGHEVWPCIENEGACFIKTTADLAAVGRRYADPNLKFIWEPGNSTLSGHQPRREDFETLLERIVLVHLKDGIYDEVNKKGLVRLVGEGHTDYQTELTWLAKAHYTGPLTFEPHYCPEDDCVEGMRQSVGALRRIADAVGIQFH